MIKLKILFGFLLILATAKSGCKDKPTDEQSESNEITTIESEQKATPVPHIIVGAERTDQYLPLLKNQRVALLVNQTSMIGNTHLADTLLRERVQVVRIFAPEHGFRGTADRGQLVADGKDIQTGLPIISLYGDHKKPTKEDLQGLDILIFDIQDVGARFYTYISSMHYVMEACAENGVKFMVLDRPNPNGHYVDGPVLQKSHTSFVGMHPVPVVHGMTVGEYAQMINGEGWLKGGQKVGLTVIPCSNYDHKMSYNLPVKPSPNLPNDRSIYLYPSLCFFEGTPISVGRGTNKQFQLIGHPDYPKHDFSFTPVSMPGATKPVLQNKLCYGIDLSKAPATTDLQAFGTLQLDWIIHFYKELNIGKAFFNKNGFFDTLAGGASLREQIIEGKSADEIRAGWASDLAKFKAMRSRYLLYKDF